MGGRRAKPKQDGPLRYRVVYARYVSRHATIDQAVAAMNEVELERADDIAFVLEEK